MLCTHKFEKEKCPMCSLPADFVWTKGTPFLNLPAILWLTIGNSSEQLVAKSPSLYQGHQSTLKVTYLDSQNVRLELETAGTKINGDYAISYPIFWQVGEMSFITI